MVLIITMFQSCWRSNLGGIGDQFLATGLLVLCVCAITDRRNMQVAVFIVTIIVIFIIVIVPTITVIAIIVTTTWPGDKAAGPPLHRSHRSGDRNLLRLQLRLRAQPCQGLCAQALQYDRRVRFLLLTLQSSTSCMRSYSKGAFSWLFWPTLPSSPARWHH